MTVSVQTGGWSPVSGPTVGLVAQFVLLAGLSAGVGLGPTGWLVATAYAVGVWAALTHGLRRYAWPALGAANAVTLGRATLVGGVTALVADAGVRAVPVWTVAVLATVALLLDAVDGQVARRTGTTSALGARFDMEVDAFLILVLSVLVARTLGGWVIAAGAARYVFVAAVWVLPWLGAALPPSLARKTVAAMQGVVLTVAGAAVLPEPLTTLVVGAALVLLGWSFGRDVRWLARRRPAVRYRVDTAGTPGRAGPPAQRSRAPRTVASVPAASVG